MNIPFLYLGPGLPRGALQGPRRRLRAPAMASGMDSAIGRFVADHLAESTAVAPAEMSAETNLSRLGVTSASAVAMQAAVAKAFRFQPSPTAFLDYPTLGELVGHYEAAFRDVEAQPAHHTPLRYVNDAKPRHFFPWWCRLAYAVAHAVMPLALLYNVLLGELQSAPVWRCTLTAAYQRWTFSALDAHCAGGYMNVVLRSCELTRKGSEVVLRAVLANVLDAMPALGGKLCHFADANGMEQRGYVTGGHCSCMPWTSLPGRPFQPFQHPIFNKVGTPQNRRATWSWWKRQEISLRALPWYALSWNSYFGACAKVVHYPGTAGASPNPRDVGHLVFLLNHGVLDGAGIFMMLAAMEETSKLTWNLQYSPSSTSLHFPRMTPDGSRLSETLPYRLPKRDVHMNKYRVKRSQLHNRFGVAPEQQDAVFFSSLFTYFWAMRVHRSGDGPRVCYSAELLDARSFVPGLANTLGNLTVACPARRSIADDVIAKGVAALTAEMRAQSKRDRSPKAVLGELYQVDHLQAMRSLGRLDDIFEFTRSRIYGGSEDAHVVNINDRSSSGAFAFAMPFGELESILAGFDDSSEPIVDVDSIVDDIPIMSPYSTWDIQLDPCVSVDEIAIAWFSF